MPVFAVTYTYTDDVSTRDAHRTAHRDYLRLLADEGTLLVSGPFGPGERAGALLVFRAADKAAVDRLVDGDPFSIEGVVATATVTAWEPILGALDTHFAA